MNIQKLSRAAIPFIAQHGFTEHAIKASHGMSMTSSSLLALYGSKHQLQTSLLDAWQSSLVLEPTEKDMFKALNEQFGVIFEHNRPVLKPLKAVLDNLGHIETLKHSFNTVNYVCAATGMENNAKTWYASRSILTVLYTACLRLQLSGSNGDRLVDSFLQKRLLAMQNAQQSLINTQQFASYSLSSLRSIMSSKQ